MPRVRRACRDNSTTTGGVVYGYARSQQDAPFHSLDQLILPRPMRQLARTTTLQTRRAARVLAIGSFPCCDRTPRRRGSGSGDRMVLVWPRCHPAALTPAACKSFQATTRGVAAADSVQASRVRRMCPREPLRGAWACGGDALATPRSQRRQCSC